jgi:hypothetical protein
MAKADELNATNVRHEGKADMDELLYKLDLEYTLVTNALLHAQSRR